MSFKDLGHAATMSLYVPHTIEHFKERLIEITQCENLSMLDLFAAFYATAIGATINVAGTAYALYHAPKETVVALACTNALSGLVKVVSSKKESYESSIMTDDPNW